MIKRKYLLLFMFCLIIYIYDDEEEIFAQLWQINNNLKSSGGGGSLRQHSLNKHCIIKLSTQPKQALYYQVIITA